MNETEYGKKLRDEGQQIRNNSPTSELWLMA